MAYSLRTIALLMLLAGICLGVFASSLIAVKRTPVRLSLEQTVEEQVKYYREYFDLDVRTTDAVRRELHRFRRVLRDKLVELRQLHADEFTKVKVKAEERIQKILKSAGVAVGAPDEGGVEGR